MSKKGNFRLLLFGLSLFSLVLFFPPRDSLRSGLISRQSVFWRDALGHDFSISQPPKRIISLAPNITEILFELGIGEKIVGTTRFCNYPPEVNKIDRVGGIIDPSLEKMIALRPDLILAFRGTPLQVLAKIRSSGLPLFVIDEGEKIEELFSLIKIIGLVTGSQTQASALNDKLQSRLRAVQVKVISAPKEPKVFLLLSGPGNWTCGQKSFLHDLIIKAGGQNIAASQPRRWVSLGPEELMTSSPDVIVILAPSEKAFLTARENLLREPFFMNLPAVVQTRFGWLDEDEASRFGPRLIKALEDLVRLLHPNLFK